MNTKIEQMLTVPFTNLRIDENNNCRGIIALGDIMELAESIEKDGQISPVLARYKHDDETFDEEYVLVAGFSRSKAIRDILKRESVTAVIRPLTKQQCLVINAIENLKRRDLNLMQEAESLRRMVRSGFDRADICRELGKTTGWVQPRLYLLQLPEPVQNIAAAGYLTTDNIRSLYSLTRSEDQIAVARQIKEKKQRSGRVKVSVKAFANTKETRISKAKIARARDKGEIENLQDWLEHINFPYGIHMRFLAWASGNIDDLDLQASMQTFLMQNGRHDFFVNQEGIPDMKAETL